MTGVFCSLLNYTSSEECLFDNECTELPEEIANILRCDRACMPTGNSLVFGTTYMGGSRSSDAQANKKRQTHKEQRNLHRYYQQRRGGQFILHQ